MAFLSPFCSFSLSHSLPSTHSLSPNFTRLTLSCLLWSFSLSPNFYVYMLSFSYTSFILPFTICSPAASISLYLTSLSLFRSLSLLSLSHPLSFSFTHFCFPSLFFFFFFIYRWLLFPFAFFSSTLKLSLLSPSFFLKTFL